MCATKSLLTALEIEMISASSLQTILLQNREGQDYCVACSDLASDSGKDDPGQ